jgi:succinate dehydrogenase / fumarate reductase, cytochrome b subunit
MTKLLELYESTLGKKAVMAVSGIILFLFIVVHMLGNLQIYIYPEGLNHEALLLRRYWPLLWLARVVLLSCVGIHVLAAAQLWWRNRSARPVKYRVYRPPAVDYAAKTMIWSGPIIAAFVVFHILHFTTGSVHPDFREVLVGGTQAADVFHNVVVGFKVAPAAIFYMLANLLLGVHLYHGLWSLFQTLGWDHPLYAAARRPLAVVVAAVIAAVNISIPLSVLTGLVR